MDVGVTGEECRFQIHNLKGKIELLSMTIDGPSVPSIKSEADDDGNINCNYIPQLPGKYSNKFFFFFLLITSLIYFLFLNFSNKK